jgi:hypothetical protein
MPAKFPIAAGRGLNGEKMVTGGDFKVVNLCDVTRLKYLWHNVAP